MKRGGLLGPRQVLYLFFCAAVEDGATASSHSSTSKNEASRPNGPGTRLPEDPYFLDKLRPLAILGDIY